MIAIEVGIAIKLSALAVVRRVNIYEVKACRDILAPLAQKRDCITKVDADAVSQSSNCLDLGNDFLAVEAASYLIGGRLSQASNGTRAANAGKIRSVKKQTSDPELEQRVGGRPWVVHLPQRLKLLPCFQRDWRRCNGRAQLFSGIEDS